MSKNSDFTTKIIIVVFLVLVLVVAGFFVFQMVNDDGQPEENADQSTSQPEDTTPENFDQSVTPDSNSSPQTEETRCLITVRDKQYDVTDFRSQHPGGNVFECGTDMTDLFNSEHGMDYDRLRPYLVE